MLRIKKCCKENERMSVMGSFGTLVTTKKDSVSLETSIEILQNECKRERSDIIVLKREEG